MKIWLCFLNLICWCLQFPSSLFNSQPNKNQPSHQVIHGCRYHGSSSHGDRALLRFLQRSYNCVVAKVREKREFFAAKWEREKKIEKSEEIGEERAFYWISYGLRVPCSLDFFSTYYVPREREGIFPEHVVKTWGVWSNGGQIPWEMADNWRCHTQQQRIVDWFIAMVSFLPFFGTPFGMVSSGPLSHHFSLCCCF